MKKTIITGISTLLLLCLFPSFNISAENKADKYLGKRSTCLEIFRIDETEILDDQTVLFRYNMNEIYINRLPNPCPGLKIAGAFSYSTSFDRLCKQDIIAVLEEDGSVTARCGLGEFIRLKGVTNISEAVKLLVDEGVLDSLAKEGAFEKAFPDKGK